MKKGTECFLKKGLKARKNIAVGTAHRWKITHPKALKVRQNEPPNQVLLKPREGTRAVSDKYKGRVELNPITPQ